MSSERGQITHKLLILIPGKEKPSASFHPDETTARHHLRARLAGIPGVPVGIPPLPAGTTWRITAMIEEEVAKGTVGSLPGPDAHS
jgi:hypothetical protein